ncbi:glycosyltransferase family 2 protein [Pedobacter sp. SD-b]|uniref:Glycosyltransferase family 2 protein n=1 Tax=Pedobacter segetis TaxID=2793069 RepID=A0ABS1BGT7_9SPHI|nr:glycosyltransferase family 2 protein [Pedobacter segetis]MBK0382068.1 glycosyltransferase family 2 protein [Pedobacter segetis]
MPRVSVIIPNYNHENFLNQRIETVLSQTFQDIEVIILDDCSTDSSKQVIESYSLDKRVSVVYNSFNSGSPFIQWARGITIAKGDYIWIAESDDWSELDFLTEVIRYADLYPDASLIYTDSYIIKDSAAELMGAKTDADFKFFEPKELIKQHLLNGIDIYNGSAVVFKRQIAFNELEKLVEYKKHGDYFFWIILSKDYPSVFINKRLNYFRILESSVTKLSNQTVETIDEYYKIFKVLVNISLELKWKDRYIFYNCWALRFIKLYKEVTYKINIYDLLKKVFIASRYSPYFLNRMIYHFIMS